QAMGVDETRPGRLVGPRGRSAPLPGLWFPDRHRTLL
ncbi:uncharacterized protein METZ01_LOCUS144925, partial [marine metagenome]